MFNIGRQDWAVIMVALWNKSHHYTFVVSSFFLSFVFLSFVFLLFVFLSFVFLSFFLA